MTEPSDAIQCELSEPDLDERSSEWRALRPWLRSGVRTDEGFRLTFDAVARERIEELAAAERSCCGWATWSVGSDGGHVVLDVSGPQSPVEALAAAFGV